MNFDSLIARLKASTRKQRMALGAVVLGIVTAVVPSCRDQAAALIEPVVSISCVVFPCADDAAPDVTAPTP